MRCAAGLPVLVVGLLRAVSAVADVTPPPAAAAPERLTVVGRLTLQEDQECGSGVAARWVDPHLEAGFVRLGADPNRVPSSLRGSIVVVKGRRDPDAPLPRAGWSCLPAQMRSDFVLGRDGFRVLPPRPGRLATLGGLADVGVYAGAKAPTVEVKSEAVRFRLANPLARDLSKVRVVGHYEGCGGKPSAVDVERAARPWPGTGELSEIFEALRTGERGRGPLRLDSIRVLVDEDDVVFDLDWPVNSLVSCPQR